MRRACMVVLVLVSGCRGLLGIEELPNGDGGVPGIDAGPVSLSISPGYQDLGAGLVGGGPGPSTTFTVTNLAIAATPPLAAVASGAHPGEFTVTGGTCAGNMLAPQATCTV